MKLYLSIKFRTDGDFYFDEPKKLFYVNNSMYKGAEIHYKMSELFEDYQFTLSAVGNDNACRWAARDLIENLITSFRVGAGHYWLIKDVYNMLVYPKEKLLWGAEDVFHTGYLTGNYDGSYIRLVVKH